ncbi:hypothetical protein BJX68DRAFT_269996 [Aspergillus pseudodeflectus]|uniref:Uncharacterized protein n=1 Tax=Aspergillus pseudodeflectus TaxID=176178 RepID=A0ABR4JUW5_9EURO
MWQYYNIDSTKKTLVKQANRIEAKLKNLEDIEIMKNLGTTYYDKPYISQDLSTLMEGVDGPKVNIKPGQMRQKNKAIVTIFEVYLAAVQNLQAWDIDWDMDTSDNNSGSGNNDDGMDID